TRPTVARWLWRLVSDAPRRHARAPSKVVASVQCSANSKARIHTVIVYQVKHRHGLHIQIDGHGLQRQADAYWQFGTQPESPFARVEVRAWSDEPVHINRVPRSYGRRPQQHIDATAETRVVTDSHHRVDL